ncbi:MAG: ParB/RepB/Spo0J family partition protein [Candidatus Pacebacteria bacterium]|jgi:ParB family chromosome partitioning protein|nr:ParB/RepB/Spo0J family partition protein [Candidatus Paceibacterota bacterium]
MAFQADSIFWVEVEKIVPNPFQPRREFDESKLKELSESIRMYGILQPLTVTRREIQGEDGSFHSEYELIAGERRLRASKLAGLQIVPVIIRSGEQTEQEKLELAIIENLQREDLNAVDRALAFRQLADVFGLSHGQVAVKVGRSREYVSNSIRLLALPDYMLDALRTNDMSEGHARTLLMLNDRPEEQDVVFREILLKRLSVREVEKIARGIATEKVRKKELIDDGLLEMEKQFTNTLGTRVSITKTEFGGRLTIDYFSVEDLESMLERMKKDALVTARTPVPADYKDESKDSLVSEAVDEEEQTLAELARATGIEPIVPVQPVAEVPSVLPAPLPRPPVVVPEIVVTPTPTPIAVPVPQVAIPVPPPVASAKPSLRDQLASLLGNRTPAVETPTAPAAPVPVRPAPLPRPEVVEPLERQTNLPVEPDAAPKVTPAETTKDESDLYSINRFTI